MLRARIIGVATLAAAAAITLSACGSTTGHVTPTPPPAAPAAPAPPPAPPPATALATAKAGKLGTVVVDGRGLTLYRFDKDSAKPPASNCADACATTWPPLLVASADAARSLPLTGVNRAKVGTVERSDGALQLTIGGWPVYTYSGDTAGEWNGQGIGGTWFAVKPDGKKAGAAK